MNKIKKMIIAILIGSSTCALASEEPSPEVKNSYTYWSIGAGIPTVLSTKFGHREQRGKNGFEYGVGVTPLIFIIEGHIFASYLYFPNPNLQSQYYVGLGLRAGGFIKSHAFAYIAPGVMLGKDYLTKQQSKRFVQVAISPGGLSTKGFISLSSISLAWGYSF